MTLLASARSTSSRSSASEANGPSLKPRPGRDRVADQDQHPRQRPEHLGEGDQRSRGQQRDPLGVLATDGARGDPDHHEGDDQHDRQRRQHRPPAAAVGLRAGLGAAPGDDQVEHHHGDQDDRGDLGEHPQEQRGVQVARRVLDDHQQPGGAAGALGRDLLGPGLGERRERGVRAAEQSGDHGEDGCQDQQPDVDDAHVRLPARLPRCQQRGLQAEHLLVLVGLGVVVAEQVQDPVHGQQVHLVPRAVAGLGGLPLRDRGAEHQVAEDALLGLLVDQAGAQLVHREGQHVGGALLLHPLLVELGDGRLVHELDAQLGLRVHAHLVHHEARQPGQLGYVELGTRLVEDLDAHAGPRRGPRRAASGPGSSSPRAS